MQQLIDKILNIPLSLGVKVEEGLETAAETAEIGKEENIPRLIGNILEYVLGFVGVILLIVIIYGGFMWMTAGGDEDRIKKARGLLINGVIGVAIIALSYAILSYIMTRFLAPLQ